MGFKTRISRRYFVGTKSRKISTLFILLTALLIGVIVLYILPKIEITLVAQTEPFTASFEIKLDKNVPKVLVNLGILPAQIIGVNREESVIFFTAENEKKNLGSLQEKVKEEINEKVPQGWKLINELISVDIKKIPSQNRFKIKAKALIFKEADLREIITARLKLLLPEDKKIIGTNEKILRYEVKKVDFERFHADLKIHVETFAIRDFPLSEIKKELLKRKENEFLEYLKRIEGVREVKLKFWPKIGHWPIKIARAQRVFINIVPFE